MSEKVSKSERPSEGEWFDQLGRLCPETAIPGFWDTLVQDCSDWAKVTTVGPFWSEAEKLLPSWASGYHAKYDYSLLTKPGPPNFIGKKVVPIRSKILNDYPGHMIHLADGLLVELRDTSRTEDTMVRQDDTIRQSLQRKYIIQVYTTIHTS